MKPRDIKKDIKYLTLVGKSNVSWLIAGEMMGISNQRVSQLTTKYGIPVEQMKMEAQEKQREQARKFYQAIYK